MKIFPGKFFVLAAAVIFGAIAFVTSSGTAPPNSTPPEIEKAVLARLNEIQTAAQAFDADKVFSHVLENDAGSIAQNGRISLTRSNALETTRENFAALQNAGARVEYHFDQQHVTLLSPSMALVVGDGTTDVITPDGQDRKTQFAQSVLLVLTNGDWKVFHAHRSFVQPAM